MCGRADIKLYNASCRRKISNFRDLSKKQKKKMNKKRKTCKLGHWKQLEINAWYKFQSWVAWPIFFSLKGSEEILKLCATENKNNKSDKFTNWVLKPTTGTKILMQAQEISMLKNSSKARKKNNCSRQTKIESWHSTKSK